ncbi:MAG: hypothetical protein JNL08_15130 [Planctomycetes bacterium]|nr:hypothetical protein [Planctomycetota bacterium]
MNRRCRVVAIAALSLAAGCVQGSYDRAAFDEPIAVERLQALRPGQDDLRRCLAELGAPHRVFEHAVAADGSAGVALLWYWRDQTGFGVELSSGRDDAPGSLSYDQGDVDLPGCMLWFGRDLVLERWQQGLVGDLVPRRARPTAAAGD